MWYNDFVNLKDGKSTAADNYNFNIRVVNENDWDGNIELN